MKHDYYAMAYMARTHIIRNLSRLGGKTLCGLGIPHDHEPCDFPDAPGEAQPLCERCETVRLKRERRVFRLEAQS